MTNQIYPNQAESKVETAPEQEGTVYSNGQEQPNSRYMPPVSYTPANPYNQNNYPNTPYTGMGTPPPFNTPYTGMGTPPPPNTPYMGPTPPNYMYGSAPQPYPPYYNYRPGPNAPAPAVQVGLARFWSRFVAILIDGIVVGIPSSILVGFFTFMFSLSLGVQVGSYFPSWTVQVCFWGVYAWLCYTFLNGNTFGKSIMGLKLVNSDGSKPSLSTFILHYTVGYWINGIVFVLGFLWALFDANKQTWGQKIFKDYTVYGRW